jgi:hypothetical protein
VTTLTVQLPRKVATTATSGAALTKGKHTPVNATSAPVTMTLPIGAAEGVEISVEKVDGSANAVTVSGNIRGVGASTISLTNQNDLLELRADASGSWWPTARALSAAAYVENITTVTGGASKTLSAPTTATVQRVNLNSANCTFTFPSAVAGYSFTVELIQDASGFRAVTWPASVRWADSSAPTLSTGSNKRDLFSFLCTDGSTWLGFVAGQNYAA